MKETNPFKLKESKIVYKNPWIQVREDAVVRPGGKDGIFGVVDMKEGVTVIALDKEGNVFLTLEYAYAIGRDSLECISGGIDVDEDILAAAKRELLEEVGGVSDSWTYLGCIDPFTGIIQSANHIYLARDTRIESVQKTDEGEVIEVIKVPFSEVYKKTVAGEITHGASVVAVLKTHILLNQQDNVRAETLLSLQ